MDVHVSTDKYLSTVYDNCVTQHDLPLQKYKRIAFLRFVIAFGIEFPNSKILQDKLVQFDNEVFENNDD